MREGWREQKQLRKCCPCWKRWAGFAKPAGVHLSCVCAAAAAARQEDLQTKMDAQTLAAEQTLEKIKSAHKSSSTRAGRKRRGAARAGGMAASAQSARGGKGST